MTIILCLSMAWT